MEGAAVCRQHVIPSNPRLPAQLGIRAMLKFLSQAWKPLTSSVWGDWAGRADQKKVSPFNAYIGYNMSRWREFQGVSQLDPAAEAHTATTVTMAAPDGNPRSVVIGLTPGASANQWAMVLFRDTATITTVNWDLAIAVLALDGTNQVLYTDAPLDVGTYHYRAAALTDDGKIGTACADQSGAAT